MKDRSLMAENIINMLKNKHDTVELTVALNKLPNRRALFEEICQHLNIDITMQPTISAMKNSIIEYSNNLPTIVDVFAIDNLEELNSHLSNSNLQRSFSGYTSMKIYTDYVADLCLQGHIDEYFNIWNGVNNISYEIQEIREHVSRGVDFKPHISTRIFVIMQNHTFTLTDFIILLNRTKILFPNPILEYFEHELLIDLKKIMKAFGY